MTRRRRRSRASPQSGRAAFQAAVVCSQPGAARLAGDASVALLGSARLAAERRALQAGRCRLATAGSAAVVGSANLRRRRWWDGLRRPRAAE